MTQKARLNAMKYLAKKIPKRYRIKHNGDSVILLEARLTAGGGRYWEPFWKEEYFDFYQQIGIKK